MGRYENKHSIHKLVLYFKIVKDFTPNYLSDLLPQTVQQRSGLILIYAFNFTLFPIRTERFKKPYFPSSTILWNSIDYVERNTLSISVFKKSLFRFFDIQSYNEYNNFPIDRYSLVLHCHLRLNSVIVML